MCWRLSAPVANVPGMTAIETDLIVRPLTLDDAPELTRLYAAGEAAEPEDEHYSLEDLVEELERPNVDLVRASIAVEKDGRLVGAGVLEPRFDDGPDQWQAYLSGQVDPAFTRQGIGRLIVEDLLAKAAALRDEADPTRSVQVKIYAGDPKVGTAALAAAVGFEPIRWFFKLRHPLAEPVEVSSPADPYSIRPYQPADEEGTRLASNDSFADHWGSMPMDQETWRKQITEARNFRPDLSFVSVARDGRIVGFSLVDEFAAETEVHGYSTGWIQRLGVISDARGAGIATALLTASLQNLQDNGFRYSELSVDGDSPTGANRLYERVGFLPGIRITAFHRILPGQPAT